MNTLKLKVPYGENFQNGDIYVVTLVKHRTEKVGEQPVSVIEMKKLCL